MQLLLLQSLERDIDMKHYIVQITDKALADMEEIEPECAMGLRQLPVDNYSVFYVIKEERVIVIGVLYSASDIGRRLLED